MKLFNKLLAVFLMLALVFSVSACKGNNDNQNSNRNENSKPVVSTPVDKDSNKDNKPEDNSSGDKSQEDKTPVDDKQEDPKPNPEPKPEPEPAKKTPEELIVGKWTATSDFSSTLIELGYEVTEPVEITLTTEFTPLGSILEIANQVQMDTAMRMVMEQELLKSLEESGITVKEFESQIGMTFDEFITDALEEMQMPYTIAGEYYFKDGALFVKFEGDETFSETTYEFLNDDKVKITTDSDETIYTRIK